MREIKFRAWNKENLVMTTPAMPTFNGGMESKSIFDYAGHLYEFMQFTGLCDKNGKEIFEGDILSDKDKDDDDGPNYFWKVIWNNDLAGWLLEIVGGVQQVTFETEESTDYEIVGNIFENPELLK